MKDEKIRTLECNGSTIPVWEGDTLASCLMRAGIIVLRISRLGEPRGIYCGMGYCHECLVTVDGTSNVLACLTDARPGSHLQAGHRYS